MSKRFYLLDVTVAAGTPATAPARVAWPLEDGFLETITVWVPDGHNGLTGIRFKWSTAVIVPTTGALFIVANDEVVPIPWGGEVTAGALTVEAYNTGVFAHTFHCRAVVSDRPAAPAVSVVSPQAGAAGVTDASAAVAGLAAAGPAPPITVGPAGEPPLPVTEAGLESVVT